MIARWWPLIGVLAMLLLGWAVRGGPVPIDDWFLRLGADMGPYPDLFLVFSKPLLVTAALVIGIVVAVRQHRTQLAIAMVVSPPVAFGIMRICKLLIGRTKEGALAYPSGHITHLVVVAGLLVLVAGVCRWAVVAAVILCLLGMFGVSMTFHYFTDTIGAALLATSVVCAVALLTRAERLGQVGSTSPGLR